MLQLFFKQLRGNPYVGSMGGNKGGFCSALTSLNMMKAPVSENLMDQEKRQMLISEIKKKLRGPLADEQGNLPKGADRPIAIEVDGPSHFYVNTTKYTAYTKLKHRLLTRMGYKVLHVPYFEWRKLRGAKERETYMKAKLQEEPSEWLDPDDEKYYRQGIEISDDPVSSKPPPPPSTPRPTNSQFH
jgi:hypothetical protein